MVHELKTWTEIFKDMKSGKKAFDVRFNDRDFKIGDELILKEYDESKNEYTGDHIHALVTWILPAKNPFIDLKGHVIMSLKYDYER